MPEKTQKRHNYEVNMVIERILEQNPQIVRGRIELFSEVYYPIARLEMDMLETTFEDFDIIPLSVLKFVNVGLTDADEIAQMMGLSRNYIQKILDLLMGYGYVSTTGVTDLGKTALKIEKKVGHSAVKQIFQADAVTGDLLKIAEQQSEVDLQSSERTFGIIPHMPHIEGISMEEINKQLEKVDLMQYKPYQGDILNANVEEIHRATCIGLEYVKAYLVKLQGISSPLIITYRYDITKKEFKERFKWQPMRIPSEKAYSEYHFSRDIPLYTEDSLTRINEIYALVCKEVLNVDEKRFKKLLEHIHPFNYKTMDISMGRILSGVPEQIYVYVNADSFTRWNPFVLTFLSQFSSVGGYVFTSSWLNGLFIRFESQSAEIRKTAKEYQKVLRHYKKNEVNTFIRNKLFNEEVNRFQISELLDTLEEFCSMEELNDVDL